MLFLFVLAGILHSVGNLLYTTVGKDYNVSWTAPFSLDVPSAHPDITYCIYMHDETSSLQILIKCNISDTNFTLSRNYTECSDHVVYVIAMNPVGNSTPSTLHLPIKGYNITNKFFEQLAMFITNNVLLAN